MVKETKKFTTVSIPATLFVKIQERIKTTGFHSVSSYVTYVMRELVSEDEENNNPFSAEDEERVKEKLRALGYMD